MANTRYTTRLTPILKNKAVTNYSPTVFSLITIIIFIIFAIHPTIKTIISLQKTINDQTKVYNNLKMKSQTLASAINSYNSIPDDTKFKLFTLLPNSTNATCLLIDLSNMSNNTQSNVIGLQLQPAELNRPSKCILDIRDLDSYRQNITPTVNLKELSFTITGQANYGQLSNFLSLFNSSTRLINIETANFSKPGEGLVSVAINGKAFFYK